MEQCFLQHKTMHIKSLKKEISKLSSSEALSWCEAIGVDPYSSSRDAYQQLRHRATNADTKPEKSLQPQSKANRS
jgi:ABC-type transporter lipoprotein component MlaA